MQRRSLGQTGRTVSAIGLGCMGMSDFYGPSDEKQSLETMATALDQGLDFFDTADMYGWGANEELIGKFIKGRRDKIVLATKFAIIREPGSYERTINNSPAYLEKACEDSLRRLGTDVIDLYYCHRRNQDTPIEEMMSALARLVEKGKIRGIGLSEVLPETLRKAHAVHPVTAVQSEYSLWTRGPEAEMLATCRELGVTFVAYSPLGRGFLAGARPDNLAETDFRHRNPRFQGEALATNVLLAEQLTQFAKDRKATAAQMAIAWLVNKNDNVVPIPGTRRSERVLENIAATEITLNAGEIAELDSIFAPDRIGGSRYPENGTVGIESPV